MAANEKKIYKEKKGKKAKNWIIEESWTRLFTQIDDDAKGVFGKKKARVSLDEATRGKNRGIVAP